MNEWIYFYYFTTARKGLGSKITSIITRSLAQGSSFCAVDTEIVRIILNIISSSDRNKGNIKGGTKFSVIVGEPTIWYSIWIIIGKKNKFLSEIRVWRISNNNEQIITSVWMIKEK